MYRIIPVQNLSQPELAVYAHLNEAQLLHYYEPAFGLFIAESPHVIGRALDAGYEPVSVLLEERYLESQGAGILSRRELRDSQIPVYTAPLAVLSQITGYHLTRGILCAMRRRALPSVEEVCSGAHRVAVLDHIENPTNVGAIFRSAAALDMDAVLLTPGCADPLQRRAVRVSVGTVFQVPWTQLGMIRQHLTSLKSGKAEGNVMAYAADAWPDRGMRQLRALGFHTVALSLEEDSIRIDDPVLMRQERLAVILGNEGKGLPPGTQAVCDYRAVIPMSHGVDSLNVAAASAVAFWQLNGKGGI